MKVPFFQPASFLLGALTIASTCAFTSHSLVVGRRYQQHHHADNRKSQPFTGFSRIAASKESDLSTEELDRLSKKEIVVSASINLPFSADVAFSAFADLPRQPSWSSWLHSVTYIEDDENEGKEIEYTECGIPLRETKWVMKWKKAFRFSWKSKVTKLERPKEIQWESTSGLKNMGRITFTDNANVSTKIEDYVNDNDLDSDGNVSTGMILEMKFIAPRIVASMMRRSDAISSFMEDQMLTPTLVNFRKIVLEDDLGVKSRSK